MNTHICWCDGHVSTEKYRAYKRRTHKKRPSYGQSYCFPSTNPPATAFKGAEGEVLFIIWTYWRALICALSFFGRCHHYLFPAYIISIWQRRSSKEHSFACMCLCNALTAISRDCELVTNASFHGLFRVLLPSTHTHTHEAHHSTHKYTFQFPLNKNGYFIDVINILLLLPRVCAATNTYKIANMTLSFVWQLLCFPFRPRWQHECDGCTWIVYRIIWDAISRVYVIFVLAHIWLYLSLANCSKMI